MSAWSTSPLAEALKALLREPYGCPFCDSGMLRNPRKVHLPDCGYALAATALRWAKDEDAAVDRIAAEVLAEARAEVAQEDGMAEEEFYAYAPDLLAELRKLTAAVGELPESAGAEIQGRDLNAAYSSASKLLDRLAAVSPPDDAPRCYVKGCGETEDLEPCFVGEYVCQECKASQRHQRDVAGEFALEGAES